MVSILRVSLLLLSLSVCLTNVLSVSQSYADRAFRGWSPETISANRFDESALIIDGGEFVKLIQEGRPGPPGPPAAAPPSPPVDPSLSSFNLTSIGASLDHIASAQQGFAWIVSSKWLGRGSRASYLIYVDLVNQVVKTNISISTFSPKVGGYGYVEDIAVDNNDVVYAVQGNNVWTFDVSGKQTNSFTLSGSAAPIVSIDIDSTGSLWILEDFNSSTQANRLMQYSDSGEQISASNLNFTDIKYQDWLIDLAVDNAGNAYIASVGEPRILVWSTMNGTRGRDLHLQAGRDIEYFWPQLALVNDSQIFVAEYNLPEVQVIDIQGRGRDHVIDSPAQLEGPWSIGISRQGLIVEFTRSRDNTQAVAISTRDGSLQYPYKAFEPPFARGWVDGMTVDINGQVYVSEEVYFNQTFHQFVHVYGRGPFDHSIEVTASGPLSFDPSTQLIWIADDSVRGPDSLISAYNIKYGGKPVKSVNLTRTAGISYLTDLQVLSAMDQTFLFVLDLYHQRLVALNDDGKPQHGVLLTPDLYPLAFYLDAKTQYTFITGYTVNYTTQVQVFDHSGSLVEILLPPAGWDDFIMPGVTVDEMGTVYATAHEYDAILEWTRPHRGPPATTSSNTNNWFNGQQKAAVHIEKSANIITNSAPKITSTRRSSLDANRQRTEAARRRRR